MLFGIRRCDQHWTSGKKKKKKSANGTASSEKRARSASPDRGSGGKAPKKPKLFKEARLKIMHPAVQLEDGTVRTLNGKHDLIVDRCVVLEKLEADLRGNRNKLSRKVRCFLMLQCLLRLPTNGPSFLRHSALCAETGLARRPRWPT